MHVVITLAVGLVIGLLAKVFVHGRDPAGTVFTVLLAVAGAFIAGMLGHTMGWYAAGESPGIVASILGAIGLLAIYRAIASHRSW